jgi:hypothetical protein
MAAAHRQAALTTAGAGLTVLTTTPPVAAGRPLTRHPITRGAGIILSAALGLSLAVGTALAADAGGIFYPARLGLEMVLLPSDPSERALAELARLESRLQEAQAASARGDAAAMTAAMDAYAAILDGASRNAIAGGDPVAQAALEAGVARNIEVLEAILEGAPAAAVAGLTNAIERSDRAVDEIGGATNGGGNGDGNGNGGKPATGPGGSDPTDAPVTEPTETKEPKPSKTPTVAPTADPTPEPERTPRPERTPERTPVGPPDEPGPPDDPGAPDGAGGPGGDQGGGD